MLFRSTDDAIVSFLRVSADEAVLVIVNLSDQPVDEVWLAKSDSDLAEGTYQLVPVLGSGDFAPLEVTNSGGIFHLIDAPQIDANGVYILQLQAATP